MTALKPRWRAELDEVARMVGEQRRSREDELRRMVRGVLKKAEEADEAARPSIRALEKLGWTIPLWATIPFTEVVIEKVEPSGIDSFFGRSYRADNYKIFRKMLKKMKENMALSQWRALLEQCATVFRQHQYLVVVPSLLLILEGVLLFPPGAPKRHSSVKAISKRRFAESEWLWANVWLSVDTFFDEVFKSHEFSRDRQGIINRHWILHGRDETNWTEADCLR